MWKLNLIQEISGDFRYNLFESTKIEIDIFF